MPDELEQQLDQWGEAELARAGEEERTKQVFLGEVRRQRSPAEGRGPVLRLWGAGAALAALLLLTVWLLQPGPPGRGLAPPDRWGGGGATDTSLTMWEMRHAALRDGAPRRLPPASGVSWMAEESLARRRPAGAGRG
ncbi:MAG: hypothetical protein ACF8NJ_04390 [Phycisphaerales bacterium JB038]